MASTNKTTNLGLNQWVLSDPFLMEDMNEDNRKIDAAAGANQFVKLMDITTTANAQQVDLNVSGIDFTKYATIQVLGSIKTTPLGTASQILAKINNGGAYVKSYADSSATSQAYCGMIYASDADAYFSSMKMELFGIPNSLTAAYMTALKLNGCSYYCGSYCVHDQIGNKNFAANTAIATINFISNSVNASIRAGSRFEIYGVKK